jgi:hypothetical protein
MAKNEFLANRVIVWNDVPFAQAATTISASQYIPAGAVVNKIVAMVTGAQTNLAAASATFQLFAGTNSLCSAITLKQLGAQTIPVALTMNNAGGVYVPNGGEINVQLQASQNSSYVGYPSFFIEYYNSN